MKKLLLTVSSIAAATIFLNSCGSGGDSSTGDATGGPAGSSSFVGSSVSFNPTLRFNTEGQLTYINTAAVSEFPKTEKGTPALGTYSYIPEADFQSGTLKISLPGLGGPGGFTQSLGVTDFITSKGKVRGFTLTFNTEGPFVATVQSGTILAAGKAKGGDNPGGGGGGGGGGAGNDFTFQEDGNIETGTTFSKANVSTIFGGVFGGGSLTYSPLIRNVVGQEQSFTIASNGHIQFPGIDRKGNNGPYTLSVPFTGNTDGILSYSGIDALSGGTILVTFDTVETNILTIRWDDNFFSDYEQQSFN